MTPNDIYLSPSIEDVDWRETDAETVKDVFGIEGFDYRYFDGQHPLEAARIVFSLKLRYSEDDDPSTKARVISLDGKPFALLLSCEDVVSECIVTDPVVFAAARTHVAEHLVSVKMDHVEADAASHRIPGFNGAALVKVDGEVRFVNPYHCDWRDSSLVFDVVARRRKFDEVVRPVFDEFRKSGITSPEMRARALEVLLTSIVPGLPVVVIDKMNAEGDWIACAFADKLHTHVLSVNAKDVARDMRWIDDGTTRVGPPSALAALETYVSGGEFDAGHPAAVEIETRFGLAAEDAAHVLRDWAQSGVGNLFEAVLDAMEVEVPTDALVGTLKGYRMHAFLEEHPEAYPYCQNGYPTVKQAKEVMDSVRRRAEKDSRHTPPAKL